MVLPQGTQDRRGEVPMVDIVDRGNDRAQEILDDNLAAVPKPGVISSNPGDCDLCGRWSGRLVGGVCAPCRDRWKLP